MLLVEQFESLGDNCEFGFVQRTFGVEASGLLRWAVSPPDALALAIEGRFSGIFEYENLVPNQNSAGMVFDNATGFSFHSSMTSKDGTFDLNDEKRRIVWRQEKDKVEYLALKLNSLLESGEKIFVYKQNSRLSDEKLSKLSRAISQRGPGKLLYVETGAETGSVVKRGENLYVGYIDQFAPYSSANSVSLDSWISVLQSADVLINGHKMAVPIC